jgi:hypothetical protein
MAVQTLRDETKKSWIQDHSCLSQVFLSGSTAKAVGFPEYVCNRIATCWDQCWEYARPVLTR